MLSTGHNETYKTNMDLSSFYCEHAQFPLLSRSPPRLTRSSDYHWWKVCLISSPLLAHRLIAWIQNPYWGTPGILSALSTGFITERAYQPSSFKSRRNYTKQDDRIARRR
jgi:hypothetical protein